MEQPPLVGVCSWGKEHIRIIDITGGATLLHTKIGSVNENGFLCLGYLPFYHPRWMKTGVSASLRQRTAKSKWQQVLTESGCNSEFGNDVK